jgi:hypothetical protein
VTCPATKRFAFGCQIKGLIACRFVVAGFSAAAQPVQMDDRRATFIVVRLVCQIIGVVANRNVVGRMKQQQDRVGSFRRFLREQKPIELIRQ